MAISRYMLCWPCDMKGSKLAKACRARAWALGRACDRVRERAWGHGRVCRRRHESLCACAGV
eukprot:6184010-Pleurochrysis_carterae.AAC.1